MKTKHQPLRSRNKAGVQTSARSSLRVRVAPTPNPVDETATSVVRLSFAVGPFLSILERHVTISAKAREAIARDLAEVLGHADVHLVGSPAVQAELSQTRSDDPILTTEEAARLVGVSRPYMVRLIDSGAVELHQKVGNQRRLLRSAVLRWQRAERSRQAKSLKRLAQDLDEEIFSS